MIAYLLDRFSPEWKGRMEAGAFEYLETELESALRAFPPKRTFSFADLVEIRQKAEDDILKQSAERTELFQRFPARPGFRVEIIAGDEPLKPYPSTRPASSGCRRTKAFTAARSPSEARRPTSRLGPKP